MFFKKDPPMKEYVCLRCKRIITKSDSCSHLHSCAIRFLKKGPQKGNNKLNAVEEI